MILKSSNKLFIYNCLMANNKETTSPVTIISLIGEELVYQEMGGLPETLASGPSAVAQWHVLSEVLPVQGNAIDADDSYSNREEFAKLKAESARLRPLQNTVTVVEKEQQLNERLFVMQMARQRLQDEQLQQSPIQMPKRHN